MCDLKECNNQFLHWWKFLWPSTMKLFIIFEFRTLRNDYYRDSRFYVTSKSPFKFAIGKLLLRIQNSWSGWMDLMYLGCNTNSCFSSTTTVNSSKAVIVVLTPLNSTNHVLLVASNSESANFLMSLVFFSVLYGPYQTFWNILFCGL